MRITYDLPKREANLLKHGMDFSDLEDGAFFLNAVVLPAKNGRYMAIGRLAEEMISVVFAPLGEEGLSIISMRPASRKERDLLR